VYYYSTAFATGANRRVFGTSGTSFANDGNDASRRHTGRPAEAECRFKARSQPHQAHSQRRFAANHHPA